MEKGIEKIIKNVEPKKHNQDIDSLYLNYVVNFLSFQSVRTSHPHLDNKGIITLDHLVQEDKLPKKDPFFRGLENHLHRKKPIRHLEEDLDPTTARIVSLQIISSIYDKRLIEGLKDIYDLKGLITLEYFQDFYSIDQNLNIEENMIQLRKRFLRSYKYHKKSNRQNFEKLIKSYKKKKENYRTLDKLEKIRHKSIILDDRPLLKEIGYITEFITDEIEDKLFEIITKTIARKISYLAGATISSLALSPDYMDLGLKVNLENWVNRPLTELYSTFSSRPELLSYSTLGMASIYLFYKLFSKDY